MTKVILTIIISLGLWVSFFWFWQEKNSQVFRSSNLSVQRKNVEKITVEQTVFRLFWTLTRKTCIFTGIFLAGLSKLLSTCPEDQLQSNISERRSWNLEDFWIVFEIFGTTAENIFQGWQNSSRCPGEQFMENIFSDEENSLFFLILSDFLTSGEKLCQICENRNLRIRGIFWGKTFFEIYITFHTSLDFDPKNA